MFEIRNCDMVVVTGKEPILLKFIRRTDITTENTTVHIKQASPDK